MKTSVLKDTKEDTKPNHESTNNAIDFLEKWLDDDLNLAEHLEASITSAKKDAQDNLYGPLYSALDWPTTKKQYITYLKKFSRWIPRQHPYSAWRVPETGYAQEVYDHLCHFYFLIDQKVGPDKNIIVQNIKGFDQWLVDFANLWGDFLNTPESFNDEILKSFEDPQISPYYRIEDSLVDGKSNNPSGWLTFNQFFARELNPGLRPIDSPHDNTVAVSPADCTYRKMFSIDKDSNITEAVFKKTHIIGNIAKLLEHSPHANAFANDTFVHYFLGPYSYHRFHAPVSGMVDDCRPVPGLTYLEVEIGDKGKGNQFNAPDNSNSSGGPGNGYEFSQSRGILTIDTKNSKDGDMGIVAVVPIGMCQVSGVHMIATEGREIAKGEEFGYFLFGGSDIILLFQEGKAPKIDECDKYRYYGTSISGCPDSIK